LVLPLRENDRDAVAGSGNSGAQDDSHNPGLAYDMSVVIMPNHRFQESRFECIDLSTRISKSGQFDHGI